MTGGFTCKRERGLQASNAVPNAMRELPIWIIRNVAEVSVPAFWIGCSACCRRIRSGTCQVPDLLASAGLDVERGGGDAGGDDIISLGHRSSPMDLASAYLKQSPKFRPIIRLFPRDTFS